MINLLSDVWFGFRHPDSIGKGDRVLWGEGALLPVRVVKWTGTPGDDSGCDEPGSAARVSHGDL